MKTCTLTGYTPSRLLCLATFAGLLFAPRVLANGGYLHQTAQAAPPAAVPVVSNDRAPATPKIQLAILLDTSGSMDGLINQAKSQIWAVVNTLVSLKQKGVKPTLEVALFHYGNDGIAASEQHVLMLTGLTTDLDDVSAKLFALSTNGGNEYCGAVIDKAVNTLVWSSNPDDLKIIMIAGNEAFTQGSIDYKQSVPSAVRKGIIVNTVYCGDQAQGKSESWLDGAQLGEGTYSSINTNAVAQHIDSPFDTKILELNTQLNRTYVALGTTGSLSAARQVAQDSNAANAAPAASIERAKTKIGTAYNNDTWDLVDALANGKKSEKEIEALKKEELPEEMQKLDAKDRVAYIKEKSKARDELKKQIGDLHQQREEFVRKAREAQAQGNKGQTLEDAITTSLLEQGKKRGYER